MLRNLVIWKVSVNNFHFKGFGFSERLFFCISNYPLVSGSADTELRLESLEHGDQSVEMLG